MLYYLHEMSRLSMAPARAMAEGLVLLLDHPLNPMAQTPMARAMASAADIFEHLTRSYGKPHWGLDTTTIDGVPVQVTEEVVIKRTYCDLLHFKRATDRADPRLLIVAPLSGHYATLLRGTVYDRRPLRDGDRVVSGERIETVITVETKNDYEYLVFEDEGHGFLKKENRARGYRAMREFLDTHLRPIGRDLAG